MKKTAKKVKWKGLSRDSTEQEKYFGAIIEEMNTNIKAILEVTQPIPKMQEDIAHMMKWEDDIKLIPVMKKRIEEMSLWEDDIKLIPAIFEEVGALRKDTEVLKAALAVLELVEKRLTLVEQKVAV